MKQEIRRERTLFLKELGNAPSTDIDLLASKLQINPQRAWDYVHQFLSLVAESRGDYEKIKNEFNKNVDPAFVLDQHDIDKLAALPKEYPSLVVPSQGQTEIPEERQSETLTDDKSENFNEQPEINNVVHEITNDPRKLNAPAQVQPPATPTPTTTYGAFNPAILNQSYDYSFMADLKRIGLLRWCLMKCPQPPPNSKIESFVQNFELQQDVMMASPDTLTRALMSFFGERTGQSAGTMFAQNISMLPPSEGFGKRKLDPSMGGPNMDPYNNPYQNAAQQYTDPFNTYYHAQGVIPFGMHINSPDARRLIAEFEAEKRRKIKMKEEREEFFEDMRTKMQMQMSSFLDMQKMGGNGHGGEGGMFSQQNLPLLIAMMQGGNLNIVPTTDQEGHVSYSFQPKPPEQHMPDPNQITAKDLVDFYARTNESASTKLNEASIKEKDMWLNLFNIMQQQIQNRPKVTEEMLEMAKIQKEIFPQPPGGLGGAGGTQSAIELARVMLEGDKFKADKERADKVMEWQFEDKMKQREFEMNKELEANKSKNVLIKSVSNIVANNLPVLFQLFLILTGRASASTPLASFPMGGGGGEGGGGGIGGLLGSILGGMGGAGAGGAGGQQSEEDEEGGGGGGGAGGLFGGMGGKPGAQGYDMSNISNMISNLLSGGVNAATNVAPTATSPNPTPQANSFVPTNFNLASAPQRDVHQNPNFKPVSQINNEQTPIGRTNIYEEIGQAQGINPATATAAIPTFRPEFDPATRMHAESVRQFVDNLSSASNSREEIIADIAAQVPNEVTLNSIEQPTPQEQVAQAVVQTAEQITEAEDPFPIYQPEHFEGYTKEQLQEKLAEAETQKEEERKKYNESLNSYVMALRKKLEGQNQ